MQQIRGLAVVRRVGLIPGPADTVRSYQLGRRFWPGRRGFQVAIEAQFTSVFPVLGGVVVDARPAAENTEKQVLGRFDHYADVAAPNNQVTRFRFRDPLKSVDSGIEIGGRRVPVSQPCLFVDRMNKMGAVGLRASNPRVECGSDEGQAVFIGKESVVARIPSRRLRSDLRT